jgi:hypothetical protein
MNVQDVIKLIEVLIWPLSLVIVILMFRKNISASFNRLGSITASSSGLSLNFESALEAAQEVFEQGDSSGSSKSFGKLGTETTLKPYETLVDIKKSIESLLLKLAIEHSVTIAGKSQESIVADLAQRNIINPKKSLKFQRLVAAVDAAPMSISHNQAAQLQEMYDTI